MGAQLGKRLPTGTAEQEKGQRRRTAEKERWDLLARVREFTTVDRQKACMRVSKQEDGSVGLRATALARKDQSGGRRYAAGFSGLFRCGNVWTCPCCSIKIGGARAIELQRVMGHVVGQGGTAALATFTMRHNRDQSLAECWDAISKAWNAVTSGKAWAGSKIALRDDRGRPVKDSEGKTIKVHSGDGEKLEYGVFGWDRSTEVTHGEANGWHVHIHVVLMFKGQQTRERITQLTQRMFGRWERWFANHGMATPEMHNHGLDVQFLDHGVAEGKLFESIEAMARYVSKGLAMEANLGAHKEARNGNRTMMQLLRDAATPTTMTRQSDGVRFETYDGRARDLWEEFEQASRGRRQRTSSKEVTELRRALAPETAELTDEEIADQELGGDDVAILPRETWAAIRRRAMELKHAVEYEGIEAAYAWLERTGLPWFRPTGLTEHFRYDREAA